MRARGRKGQEQAQGELGAGDLWHTWSGMPRFIFPCQATVFFVPSDENSESSLSKEGCGVLFIVFVFLFSQTESKVSFKVCSPG